MESFWYGQKNRNVRFVLPNGDTLILVVMGHNHIALVAQGLFLFVLIYKLTSKGA